MSEKAPQATFSSRLRRLDKYATVLLPDVEGSNGFVSGWGKRIAGTQIETGTVPGTDDLALFDLCASEAFTIVRTTIFYCEQRLTTASNHHGIPVYLSGKG